jgi:hypothetical protein
MRKLQVQVGAPVLNFLTVAKIGEQKLAADIWFNLNLPNFAWEPTDFERR